MATFIEDAIGDLHSAGCLSRLRPGPLNFSELPQNHDLRRRFATHEGRAGIGVWLMPPGGTPLGDNKGCLFMACGPRELTAFYGVLSSISNLTGVLLQGAMYSQMWGAMSEEARANCSSLMLWHCLHHRVPDAEPFRETLPSLFQQQHGLVWADTPTPPEQVVEQRRGIQL